MPNLNIDVSVTNLAICLSEMDKGSLVEAVRVADSIIAEVEFTQWLIKTLVEELSCDLTKEEKDHFLVEIKNILSEGE